MTRTGRLAALFVVFSIGVFLSPARVQATHAMPCPDLDGNGTVNVVDLAIEASYVGQAAPPAPRQADMDQDGDVDLDDVAYFTPPLLPPPEHIASCQDTPIGPAGAVGGLSELADVAVPPDGHDGLVWLAVGGSALAALGAIAASRRG